MKSIRTKILSAIILGMIILALVITSVSVIYISDILERDSDIITESVSNAEKLRIDEVLHRVILSAHMMGTYMQFTIDSANSLTDQTHRDTYTAKAKDMFYNIARNTEGVVAFYFRYNPELAGPRAGFFVSANAGGQELIERDTTDLTDWQSAPYDEVGWYSDPVTKGTPVWSTKYHNQSSSPNSISYVVPFYKDYHLCGVIGLEIDATIITNLVSNISVYDQGFAYLNDSDGTLYYSPVDDHILDRAHTDHGFAEAHHDLANGMELVIHADYSDIQRDSYVVMAIIIGCAVLILALFILWACYVAKKIVSPIQLLASGVGGLFDGNSTIDPRCDTDDEIGLLAKSIREASDKMHGYMKHVNALAYRDSLTGVKNRTAYNDEVESIDRRIKTEETVFSVVVADINMLKMTNDTHGHDAGNQLLVSASRVICSIFKHSPVFRIGGDEFVAILRNDDYDNRFDLISKINDSYHENPDKIANGKVDVTVAVGMADYTPGIDQCFEDVFNRADAAMYLRKQQMKAKPKDEN